MVNIRQLETRDAPLMLEWMHDESIAEVFCKDMMNMTLDDTRRFCQEASENMRFENGASIHFALSDDSDHNREYMGTVSLKNIDMDNSSAEYAISIRPQYHGMGAAQKATELILKKGFKEYGLHRIYLNVLATNKRALHFYKKMCFQYEGTSRDAVFKDGRYIDLMWYSVLDSDCGGGTLSNDNF